SEPRATPTGKDTRTWAPTTAPTATTTAPTHVAPPRMSSATRTPIPSAIPATWRARSPTTTDPRAHDHDARTGYRRGRRGRVCRRPAADAVPAAPPPPSPSPPPRRMYHALYQLRHVVMRHVPGT